MKAITTKAILTSFRSKVDGSLGFSGVTPELSSIEKAEFMELQGQEVKLLISPSDVSAPVSDFKIDRDMENKTPGQRLRAVLFRIWEQNGMEGEFEVYYRRMMEGVIEKFKERLE